MDIGPKERRKNNAVRRGERGTRPYLLRILLCRIRDGDELRNQLALRRCGRHPRNLAGRPPAEFVAPEMQRCAGKARSRRAEQTPDDGRQSTPLLLPNTAPAHLALGPKVARDGGTFLQQQDTVETWVGRVVASVGDAHAWTSVFSQRKKSRQRGRGRVEAGEVASRFLGASSSAAPRGSGEL